MAPTPYLNSGHLPFDEGPHVTQRVPFVPMRGTISTYENDLGIGAKSGISISMLDFIISVSNGSKRLESARHRTEAANGTGTVLILSPHTGIAEEIRPYLMAGGADGRRILMHECTYHVGGSCRRWVLPDDNRRLQRAILNTAPELVVIDPINMFLRHDNGILTWQMFENALTGLMAIATETNVAIMIGYVVKTAEIYDDTTNTADAESANATPNKLLDLDNPEDSNDAIIKTRAGSRTPRAVIRATVQAAVDFLFNALRFGPRTGKDVELLGRAYGFNPRILRAAREKLGVVASKERIQDGRWLWELPARQR